LFWSSKTCEIFDYQLPDSCNLLIEIKDVSGQQWDGFTYEVRDQEYDAISFFAVIFRPRPKGDHVKSKVKADRSNCRRRPWPISFSHLRERNASPHTIKASPEIWPNFAGYCGSRGWKSIDHIAIRGFLSQLYEKGLGKTSVARSLAAVRSLYRWLAQEGVVEQNPAKLVATPKLPKKLPRVPTIEEMNSVLDGRCRRWRHFRNATLAHAGTAVWMRHFGIRS